MKDIFICIVLLGVVFLKNISTPPTEKSRERIMRIIRKKYPSYQIISLTPEYADWSSTIKTADDEHKATRATAVIKNEEEQRTLRFGLRFRIWRMTRDAPDGGRNVPDDVYFMEDNRAAAGKRIDIEESVRNSWVIPDEKGRAYKKSGSGDNWYYSYHYIKNIYRTQNGSIYVLNKDTFGWELTEKTYSELDYYGNYTKISKHTAEELISTRRKGTP